MAPVGGPKQCKMLNRLEEDASRRHLVTSCAHLEASWPSKAMVPSAVKSAKTILEPSRNEKHKPFCMRVENMIRTKYGKYSTMSGARTAGRACRHSTRLYEDPPEPLRASTVWGTSYIYCTL